MYIERFIMSIWIWMCHMNSAKADHSPTKEIVRTYDLGKKNYQRARRENRDIVQDPWFDEKKRFLPVEGEEILMELSGVNFSLQIGGLLKKKGQRKPMYQTSNVISGAGYSNSWNVVITSERVLAYLKGGKAGAGVIATPIYSIIGRNLVYTVQLPLHWLSKLNLVSRIPALSDERIPVKIDLTFKTSFGEYYVTASGKGIKKYGRTKSGWGGGRSDNMLSIRMTEGRQGGVREEDELIEDLSVVKEWVAHNKRILVDHLVEQRVMLEEKRQALGRIMDSESTQDPEVDEKYEDVYVAHCYKFHPLVIDEPMYALDIVNGVTEILPLSQPDLELEEKE